MHLLQKCFQFAVHDHARFQRRRTVQSEISEKMASGWLCGLRPEIVAGAVLPPIMAVGDGNFSRMSTFSFYIKNKQTNKQIKLKKKTFFLLLSCSDSHRYPPASKKTDDLAKFAPVVSVCEHNSTSICVVCDAAPIKIGRRLVCVDVNDAHLDRGTLQRHRNKERDIAAATSIAMTAEFAMCMF